MKPKRNNNLKIPDIKHLRSLTKLLGKFDIAYRHVAYRDTWDYNMQRVTKGPYLYYGIGLAEAKVFMEGMFDYE